MGSQANFRAICKSTPISKYLDSAYLLDLRNHGQSIHTSTMSYEEMALDLKQFIEDRNLSNVVLLGHSMGGRVIFSYLQQYPTLPPLGTIIVDITPCEGEGRNYVKQLLQIPVSQMTLKQIQESVYDICKNKDKTNLIMTNLTYANKEATQPIYQWKQHLYVISDFMANGHKQFKSEYMGHKVVICGEHSEYVTLDKIETFKNVFPTFNNNDIHFIKGAGHWVQVDKPREFIQYVSAFLTQL